MLDEVSQFFTDIRNGDFYDEESGELYDIANLTPKQLIGLYRLWVKNNA